MRTSFTDDMCSRLSVCRCESCRYQVEFSVILQIRDPVLFSLFDDAHFNIV